MSSNGNNHGQHFDIRPQLLRPEPSRASLTSYPTPRAAGHRRRIQPRLRGLQAGDGGRPRARDPVRVHPGAAAGRFELVNFAAQGLGARGAVAFHRGRAAQLARGQT